MIEVKKQLTIAFTLAVITFYSSSSNSHLIGMSTYSDLNQDYFVVALHTEESEKIDINSDIYKRKIEIRVASEKLFSRQFARIWVNGSAINSNKTDLYQNTENIIEFTRCIKGNLEKGDNIVIDYNPSIGTSLFVNDIFIHTFTEPSFFNLLLGVLIGEVPLSSKIKRELLADSPKKTFKKTLELYSSLTPNDTRIAQTTLWAKKEMVENLVETAPSNVKQKVVVNSNRITTKETPKKEKPPQVAIVDKPKILKKPNKQTPAKIIKPAINVEIPTILEEHTPFTIESLLAEREFLRVVNNWVGTYSSFPVLVTDRPEKESIRFTITLDKDGNLINVRQFDKSKHAALNKGAIKLIEKSAPYPKLPREIQDDSVDLDLYFYLHWRYLR